jgi:RNA polymerase sigma factor (sigma-70 family)
MKMARGNRAGIFFMLSYILLTWGKPFFLISAAQSPDPEEREILSNLTQTGIARRRSEDLLFTKYQYFVREGMLKYRLSQDESLDAYSESILSFTREYSLGRFEGRSSLKTYLFRIYINKCVDLIRRNTSKKSGVFLTELITDRIEGFSDSSRSILQRLIDKADQLKMREQLQALGENCRKMLSYWAEGLSDREISTELEYKSADVVKTSRLRCLEKLRQLYKG